MRLQTLLLAALLASACSPRAARKADAQVSTAAAGDDSGLKDLPVGVAEASADCKGKSHKGTLDVPKEQLEGIASFYGEQYNGKLTASGEVFDMYKYSAAHRTMRLGTKVRVTNLDNGRSIDVCVNDRGPYAKDRILDLSYAAAKELGVLAEGTAPVRITILGK